MPSIAQSGGHADRGAGLQPPVPLLPGALLIFLGYTDFSAIAHLGSGTDSGLLLRSILTLIVLAPVFPVLAALILRLTDRRLARPVALVSAAVTGIVGAFLSFIAMAFSSAGELITLIHGVTLTLALVVSILLLGPAASEAGRVVIQRMFYAPVIVSVWSIAAAFVVVASATLIAAGNPFCLAVHGDRKPVASLADLRGLSFITTRSGYKDSSRWYFHGVLLVAEPTGTTVRNWSPRRLSFSQVAEPGILLDDPSKECEPTRQFLRRLRLAAELPPGRDLFAAGKLSHGHLPAAEGAA